MSEKFRNVVAKPELLAKKIRKAIEKTSPVKYVDEQRKKKNVAGVQDKNANIKDNAQKVALETLKASAWLTAGGAQFLLTLARWTTMDNPVLRGIEKKFSNLKNDKKIKSLIKKYPNLSAHVLWYFMLSALIFSGGKFVNESEQDLNNKIEITKEKQSIKFDTSTYGAFLNDMRSLTPFLIADLIVKEGVKIDPKTGMHVPYTDQKGIPTIGFGSTKLKDGSPVTMNTKPITAEEAYELARWHLEEGETYFTLYCYIATNNIEIQTSQQALGLCSIIYNTYSKLIEDKESENGKKRFGKLRDLYDKHGYAVSDSLVKECFEKYPITNLTSLGDALIKQKNLKTSADKLGGFLVEGGGIYWRRWLEAGLLIGEITPHMLLDCPVNGMYEFFKIKKGKRSEFFVGDVSTNRKVNLNTYKDFKRWLAHPVNENGKPLKNWLTIRDVLPRDVLALCESGKCEVGNKDFIDAMPIKSDIEKQTYVLGYADSYQQAVFAYKNGKYTEAMSLFENLLKKHPGNALLHNDLAATYNNMGLYDEAIKHAREIIHVIGDKSQYAAAQYNAGVAYEKKGMMQKALDNYKLSVQNGNKSVNKDVERVEDKIKKTKNATFDKGTKKLKNKATVNTVKRKSKQNYMG